MEKKVLYDLRLSKPVMVVSTVAGIDCYLLALSLYWVHSCFCANGLGSEDCYL